MEYDFQRLVVLVTLVYCGCQLAATVTMAMILAADEAAQRRQIVEKYFVYGIWAGILNSALNLFVYLSASTNFRRALIEYCNRKMKLSF